MLNIELMTDLFDILQFIFFVDGIVLRREDFSNIAIFLHPIPLASPNRKWIQNHLVPSSSTYAAKYLTGNKHPCRIIH